MVSSILPKNERKQLDLRYHSSKVEFLRSFFGRIENTKRTFWNKLTLTLKQNICWFSLLSPWLQLRLQGFWKYQWHEVGMYLTTYYSCSGRSLDRVWSSKTQNLNCYPENFCKSLMTWLTRFLNILFSLWRHGGCQRPFGFLWYEKLRAF